MHIYKMFSIIADKCDLEEYCENGGRCQGKGTDDVTCDCSETNYEGEVCQTRKGEMIPKDYL